MGGQQPAKQPVENEIRMDVPVSTARAVIKYLSRSIPKGANEEAELHNLIELFQSIIDQKRRKT